jgi:hypothetical protein
MAKRREPMIQRQARARAMSIDYRQSVTMPIRDMRRNDAPIVFLVTVYGWNGEGDVGVIPGGDAPFYKAVTRIGLDPNRYQAWIWDIPT